MTSGPGRDALAPAAPDAPIGRRGSSARASGRTARAPIARRPVPGRARAPVPGRPGPIPGRGSAVTHRPRRGPVAIARRRAGATGRLPHDGTARHPGLDPRERRPTVARAPRPTGARGPRPGRDARDRRAAATGRSTGIARGRVVRRRAATAGPIGRARTTGRVPMTARGRSTGPTGPIAPPGRGTSGSGRSSSRPSPWNRKRSSSPAAARSKRRSPPVERSTGCTSCPSDASRSRRSCCTPPPCASPWWRWRVAA